MNSKGEKQKIFFRRAEKLAQLAGTSASYQGAFHLVEFILSDERYAIESMFIREVYPLKEVSLVPGVPSFVYGLINIRRRIVSIIDLRNLFDVPVRPITPQAKAIILQKGGMEFGIVAEKIVGVKNISGTDLQENIPTLTGIHQEFFKGITSDRLLVLDAEKLLNSSSIIVNQKAGV